jgi:hypothetical protein
MIRVIGVEAVIIVVPAIVIVVVVIVVVEVGSQQANVCMLCVMVAVMLVGRKATGRVVT